MNIYDDLVARGLVNQVTHEEISEYLKNNKVTVYCGFDPTATSLHIGSLLPIITLKRFENYGHKAIFLIGGATGLIGDPSGKKEERKFNNENIVQENVKAISKQLSPFIGKNSQLLNNYDWTKNISIITFLRDYGKLFNINNMINKETVASRLEQGISYTEFSYTILQALDFEHLLNKYNCNMQIGGSDQWGNIVSGLDLIRKKQENEVKVKCYGMTMPLVLKSDGQKFGKTEAGTIWLDRNLTSPLEMYQFLYNTQDSDVIQFLKYFTFYTIDEINKLEKSMQTEPQKRLAQKALASSIVTFLHGEEEVELILKINEVLYSGELAILKSENDYNSLKEVIDFYELSSEEQLIDALITTALASSKREANEFLAASSISINGQKITNTVLLKELQNKLTFNHIFVKRGKKKSVLIKIKG